MVLGWLPAFGMETVGAGLTGWARAGDIAQHLVLPTVTLGCFFMAVYVRLTRASMLEVIGMDFVKTARAKGVGPGRVIRAHVLRNALLPVITFAGIQLGQMAGGAVLTETVFAWPGIGRLMFDALLQRDYQLLLGIFLVTSIMVVVFNLLTDVLYRLIDPRIGAGAQQEPPHEILRAPLYAQSWRGGRPGHRAAGGGRGRPLLYEESPWMMVADPLIPPFTNADYPFGTDMLGRDITAGLVWGARVSLLVGLLSTAVALGFGIVVGAIAGYCGGRIDDALMRFTEFFQTIPQLAMAVVLVAIIGPLGVFHHGRHRAGVVAAGRAAGALGVHDAQAARVRAGGHRDRPGAGPHRRHPDPAQRHVAHHRVGLVHGGNRHSHGVLAVLPGAGRPQRDELGFMIGAARTMIREAWWMSVWPGVAILLTVLAINLIGEGLNDALNPQLRKRGE